MKMVPNERLNVNKLLRHPFITGDSVFIYETRRLSTSIRNFRSEGLVKNSVEIEKIKKMNSGKLKDRKSSEFIKNDENTKKE